VARPLSIGVISETEDHLEWLASVVADAGCYPAKRLSLEMVHLSLELNRSELAEGIDAWLVDVHLDDDERLLDWLLDQQSAEVLFDEGTAFCDKEAFIQAWKSRLRDKLSSLAGSITLNERADEQGECQSNPLQATDSLWVLAASTGGPEAVAEFLELLPPELNIGFIYAQHIEPDFEYSLASLLSRNKKYKGHFLNHGDRIQRHAVGVVPVEQALDIMANGTVRLQNQGWRGRYTPSIDAIIANVAKVYRERSGVIIFSGMGDDGAAGCRIMKQMGGDVWSQSFASSVCDSMPQEAHKTGCVAFSGTPAQLAAEFQKIIGRRYVAAADTSRQ